LIKGTLLRISHLDAFCRDDTYLLHLETMNLLLVLLSTQLYSPSAGTEAGAHPFTEVLMEREDNAASLLRVLLRHYAERRSLPSQAPVYVPQATERRGVLRIVRSAAGVLPSNQINGLG